MAGEALIPCRSPAPDRFTHPDHRGQDACSHDLDIIVRHSRTVHVELLRMLLLRSDPTSGYYSSDAHGGANRTPITSRDRRSRGRARGEHPPDYTSTLTSSCWRFAYTIAGASLASWIPTRPSTRSSPRRLSCPNASGMITYDRRELSPAPPTAMRVVAIPDGVDASCAVRPRAADRPIGCSAAGAGAAPGAPGTSPRRTRTIRPSAPAPGRTSPGSSPRPRTSRDWRR